MSTPEERELRELLDACGVFEATIDLTPEQRSIVSARLDREVDRVVAGGRAAPPRRRVRSLVAGIALAAVAALVVVVTTPGGGPQVALAGYQGMLKFEGAEAGEFPRSGKPAAARLRELAFKIEGTDVPGKGDTHYVRITGWWGNHGWDGPGKDVLSLYKAVDRRSYLTPDGRTRAIEESGRHYTGYGEIATELGPYKDAPKIVDESFNSAGAEKSNPENWPTDPEQLRDHLTRDCPYDAAYCVVSELMSAANSYAYSPQVERSIYLALSDLPGVTSLGPVEDRLGRPAEAIRVVFPKKGSEHYLLISSENGRLLGWEQILTEENDSFDAPVPSLLSSTLLVESRMVTRDEMPEVPSYHKAHDVD